MDLPGWRKGLRAETSDDTNELVFPPVHRQRMGMPFVGRAPPSGRMDELDSSLQLEAEERTGAF
jgi:hypothetical protein